MADREKEIIIIILLSSILILGLTSLIIYVFSQMKKNILISKNNIQSLIYKHEKEILSTQLEIQEETFNKISREIHDNISLGLTLAKLQINNYATQNNDNNVLLCS
jgi:signal transduction histidine kinase